MNNRKLEKLNSMIRKLEAKKFYGKVVIIFQNGGMEKIVTETVLKFDEIEEPPDPAAGQ